MSAPVRIQLSRRKGWRMPANTVKVDRSTRWGNPYFVERLSGQRWNPVRAVWERMYEMRCRHWVRGPIFTDKTEAVQRAINLFAEEAAPFLKVADLAGKNLGCWCPLDQPCHADVLLELANRAPA